MAYTQLITPNLSTSGRVGYCLEYAENVCGASHIEPTAWVAWTNTKYKHTDANFPPDVICVQWYDYWQAGQQFGHVTINVPGKGIYSSPWKQGTDHAVLPSISEVERIYGVTYVGWSEDISGLRVIKGATMIEPQTIISTFADFHAGVPTSDQITYYGNHPNGYDELHTDMAKYNLDARLAAEKKVDDLTAANQKLVDQLQALKVTPDPATVVTTDPSVTVTQTGLWAAFKRFLGL